MGDADAAANEAVPVEHDEDVTASVAAVASAAAAMTMVNAVVNELVGAAVDSADVTLTEASPVGYETKQIEPEAEISPAAIDDTVVATIAAVVVDESAVISAAPTAEVGLETSAASDAPDAPGASAVTGGTETVSDEARAVASATVVASEAVIPASEDAAVVASSDAVVAASEAAVASSEAAVASSEAVAAVSQGAAVVASEEAAVVASEEAAVVAAPEAAVVAASEQAVVPASAAAAAEAMSQPTAVGTSAVPAVTEPETAEPAAAAPGTTALEPTTLPAPTLTLSMLKMSPVLTPMAESAPEKPVADSDNTLVTQLDPTSTRKSVRLRALSDFSLPVAAPPPRRPGEEEPVSAPVAPTSEEETVVATPAPEVVAEQTAAGAEPPKPEFRKIHSQFFANPEARSSDLDNADSDSDGDAAGSDAARPVSVVMAQTPSKAETATTLARRLSAATALSLQARVEEDEEPEEVESKETNMMNEMVARDPSSFKLKGRRNSMIFEADTFTQGTSSDKIVSAVIGRGGSFVRKQINDAERFRRALPEMSYEVVKINIRNRRQFRILKLTSDSIINIKPVNTITKIHSYLDVIHVSLVNHQQLCIAYKSDHDFNYVSPIAVQIVQEISNRIALMRAVDKKRQTFNVALKFQQSLALAPATTGTSTASNVMSAAPKRLISRRANKLMELTGDSEPQRVAVAVQKILFSPDTAEGRTRKRFIDVDFPKCAKSPVTAPSMVRNFVDGLHEYLLEHRKAELLKLCIDLPFEPPESKSTSVLDEDGKDCVSNIVLQEVEDAVFAGVSKLCVACLSRNIDVSAQQLIEKKAKALIDKPQSFFRIPDVFQSGDEWESAVLELKEVDTRVGPTQKLRCLLSCARAIYTTHTYEQNQRLSAEERKNHYLGADDFLPIFIFVVVRAAISRPLLLKDMLWQLCSPPLLQGEGGYYLTAYEAALEYIKNVDPATGISSFE